MMEVDQGLPSFDCLALEMRNVTSLVALATNLLINECPPGTTPCEEEAVERLTALLMLLREHTQTITLRLGRE